MNEHLKKAKNLVENYEKKYYTPLEQIPTMATAHAVIAVAELLEAAQKPLVVTVDPKIVISVPKPVEPRDLAFVPGDMVGVTIQGDGFVARDFNGRHAVVTYGPDYSGGWLVSTASGSLRCGPEELTMITRREDRTEETDRVAYQWKENK